MGARLQITKSQLIETGHVFWGEFFWTTDKRSCHYDKKNILLSYEPPVVGRKPSGAIPARGQKEAGGGAGRGGEES